MPEPHTFLQIEARSHNGSVTISIPRSFRGQLILHSHNGRVLLSSALAPRAAMLSVLNRSHTYFVGEPPSDDKWRTGTSGEGEEVDEVIGWSQYGSVKISYDDKDGWSQHGSVKISYDDEDGWSKNRLAKISFDNEDGGVRTPGVLGSLFRARGC